MTLMYADVGYGTSTWGSIEGLILDDMGSK